MRWVFCLLYLIQGTVQSFQESVIFHFYMIGTYFFSFSEFFAFNIYLMAYIDYSLGFEEINLHFHV